MVLYQASHFLWGESEGIELCTMVYFMILTVLWTYFCLPPPLFLGHWKTQKDVWYTPHQNSLAHFRLCLRNHFLCGWLTWGGGEVEAYSLDRFGKYSHEIYCACVHAYLCLFSTVCVHAFFQPSFVFGADPLARLEL